MNLPWEIVIASADVESRRALSNILVKLGVDPFAASSLRECKEILETRNVGLIFCDRALADGNSHDLLNAARSGKVKARIVVTSTVSDWDEFLESMSLGAFDVISNPCRATDVEWMILQALRDERTEARLRATAQVA